jgi:hypothetical protein
MVPNLSPGGQGTGWTKRWLSSLSPFKEMWMFRFLSSLNTTDPLGTLYLTMTSAVSSFHSTVSMSITTAVLVPFLCLPFGSLSPLIPVHHLLSTFCVSHPEFLGSRSRNKSYSLVFNMSHLHAYSLCLKVCTCLPDCQVLTTA